MKKVIELLEKARENTAKGISDNPFYAATKACYNANLLLNEALGILKKAAPHWETPEQYKERTGKAWPDGAAVFYRDRGYHDVGLTDWCLWKLMLHKEAVEKPKEINCSGVSTEDCQIICATEAGPPPEDWKPEESK
jgi:hypothetical protein